MVDSRQQLAMSAINSAVYLEQPTSQRRPRTGEVERNPAKRRPGFCFVWSSDLVLNSWHGTLRLLGPRTLLWTAYENAKKSFGQMLSVTKS